MTKLNLFLSAATLAGAAALAGQASANPVSVGYSLDGGKTITTIATSPTAPNDNGVAIGAASAGAFTFTITAIGAPTNTAPNFSSNTVSVSSSASGSIILYATQTGTNVIPPNFSIGFSNNPGSQMNVTEAFYVSNSNTAYARDTLLSSVTLAPQTQSTFVGGYGALTTPYSITEAFTITSTAAAQQLNATIVENAVPEPLSLSLLGAGLAGLGLVRARRKS